MPEEISCFVIMPFGQKTTPEGQTFDFDEFYISTIRPGIQDAGFTPIRCDEIQLAGSIHDDMFLHIAADRAVLVDLSTLNPNVFYELGVRHALCDNITILIKRIGLQSPFNIAHLRSLDYGPSDAERLVLREGIANYLKNGLKTKRTDSPVRLALERTRGEDKFSPISEMASYDYCLRKNPQKSIRIITGDIRNRTSGIDVWVNSENTHMQMSRFFDRSFSALVRFMGARKDVSGAIVEDTIATELAKVRGEREMVGPGAILSTSSGELADTHDLKRIFHVAATMGVPGKGWVPIPDIQQCIHTALNQMDIENRKGASLRSIAFPMLGTGSGGLDVYDVAPKLLAAAIDFYKSHPTTMVETIYFTAWNKRDLEACTMALDAAADLEAVR